MCKLYFEGKLEKDSQLNTVNSFRKNFKPKSPNMDASTSFEEDNDDFSTKGIQAGVGNYQALKNAFGIGSQNAFLYPDTRRNESIVEEIQDVKIGDPYRWLENPDSEETQVFIDDQNHLAESFIHRASWRDAIRAKLTEMWDFKKTECPKKFGDRYFYLENASLQNQAILYVKDILDGQPRILMDPNELSMEGAASISTYSVSPNGELIAYAISENGSEWSSIYIKNVTSSHNFLEVLNYTKLTSIRWTSDNRGFFYPRYPKPKSGKMMGTNYTSNMRQKLYYHRVGTRQDEDVMIVEFPETLSWTISSYITLDGQYLLISAGDTPGEMNTYTMDIGTKGAITRDIEMRPLFPETGQHKYLANDDETFYFLTDMDAPNFKVVSFELSESTSPSEWTTIVDENSSAVIVWARVSASDKLAICYNEHLDTRLEIRSLEDGELLKAIVFEENISAWDHYGRRDLPDLFVRVESYLNPGIIYRLDLDTDNNVETEVYEKIEIPYYDSANFTSELVFYSNDDGTNVPMTLIYKNSTTLDGSASCLLYGDGGFGRSLLPEFNVMFVLFAQNFDGVVAIANIRGGGEYGKTWWEDGKAMQKQNSIEDYVAAANFLINNKYTRASKLTIMGNFSGATTAAAAINKRPEICGAAIIDAGILDLIRFRNFTIGHLWISEYGDVEKDEELQNLLNISPLHNVRAPASNAPQYPAILTITADHDDTVVPFHSYKYVAELQRTVGQTITQTNPLMLRVYQNVGHKKGLPTMRAIEKITDIFCFMENTVGCEFHF